MQHESMDQINASQLTAEEYEKIMYVIKRDERLRRQEEQRIFNLKAEIQRLRKRGIIKPGLDQSRVCARCLTELGRIINRGAFCPVCRKKVCKVCRVNGDDDKIWVCVVCHKQMQLKAVSGEWMREFTRSASEKMRPPSSKLASAREALGSSFTDSLKQSFKGFYSQSNSSEECDAKRYSKSTNEASVDTKSRTRGMPPKLPTIDSSCQRYSPPTSAGSSGGSQENSPKPPISPVMKVYQQAVDFMSAERKNEPTRANDKEMVYRKIYVTSEKKFAPKVEKEVLQKKTSNRLRDSSSSSDEEIESPHTSLCATKSSESTPSPRTPNSYKILSGIANNQATAFQFPPSPLYSRPSSSHERQSSDEFSTTMSSLRSRSTSSETNDESSGLVPQPLPRTRRISPLRKQQAIAEESSSEPISRYQYAATELSQTSGADSGVSDCNTALSPKLFEHSKSKEDVSQLQKCPSEDSESSVNDMDGTVEKTTGYLFRKVTVKRRNLQNEQNNEDDNQVVKPSKCDQQRSLVQKSKSEDFEKLIPSQFRCNKITAVHNVPQSNTTAVNSALVALNTASAFKRFMHASCSRSLVDDPLNSNSLTKTNTKRYPKHDKAVKHGKLFVADGEPERHFVKRKHLSFDSPTKRKIKKLSDRAKRLRDTIIPCTSKHFKDCELQKVKTAKSNRFSQTIQCCEFDSDNLIARSASLPNNYCNDFSENCDLPFRSFSVDGKLWENDSRNELNFDTHSESDLDLACLIPECSEYQLVFMDAGNASAASVCGESIENSVPHRERTLKVRSHIEISNGIVYVEDSDWEMCSELGDASENISEEASDCECCGIDVCVADCEKRDRDSCQDSEADSNNCHQTYELNRQRSFAPKYLNTIKEFAFGDVSRTGNERKDQVNNSERVVTLHTNTCEQLKSVKETVRCSCLSNECTAQTASLMNCVRNRREETFFCDFESAIEAIGGCDEFDGSKSDRIPEAAIVSAADQRLIGSEDVFSAKRECLLYAKSEEQVSEFESNSEEKEGKKRIDVATVTTVAGNHTITSNALSVFGLRKASRDYSSSSSVNCKSVVCAKPANVFQSSVCVHCSPFLHFKELFTIYDFFLRPLVKKDFCLNSIKLAVNVDDVSKQIVVRNAFESAGCVEDCLCCIEVVGRSRSVIGKHAMDSERVKVDTCESILHATENIDFPTQIKLALTNELSSLKEVTDYECGPQFTLKTQPEGDCTPINVADTHYGDNTSFYSLNAFAANCRQQPLLTLVTNFCESLVMNSFADAETEISVSHKKEKKSVCFVDNSFLAGEADDNRKNEHCRLGEEELGLLRKYYLDFDFDDDTSDHVYNYDNQEMLESLVDVNDESDFKDNCSTSSEEDTFRNCVYEDNHQIYNYGNPLAYSLHTIIEESESESLPATPASSESSTSESESFQSDSKVYEHHTDPIFISEDCNSCENLCDKDSVAVASSRLKEQLSTGLFTLAECSRSNNESHINVDKVERVTDANWFHSKAIEGVNNERCTRKQFNCGNVCFENKLGTDLRSNYERNETTVELLDLQTQRTVTTLENGDSVNESDDFANVLSVKNETEKADKCQTLITPLEVLESQIARLMLAVSPESSSVSDNNSYCGSTVESNNSDYGSDVVELTEYSSDEEKSHSLLSKITGNSPGIVRRESERSVAESIDSNVSEETVYICQRLMNSLKKLTHLSFTDDPENGSENSDFVKAKAYIREQIIELMHTVQSSSDQSSPTRQRKTESKAKSSCSCQEQSEQCIACDTSEFSENCPKNEISPKKTPSESGSETISVSVSIPSYGESDNAATECEISHEMEELFVMMSDTSELENISENALCCEEDNSSLKSWEARISLFSNVKAAIETENKRKAEGKSPTAEEVTNNCQEITVNGVDVTDDNEDASNNSLTSIANNHKTVVKIDENIRADNMSPLFESLKDRSFSSDSVSSIQTVKARSVNMTAASISELSSEENVCNSRITVDEQKTDLQSGAAVVRKSFNAKEKASSENNLLVVNFMSQTKTSSGGTNVTVTKSTGNISDIEVTCSKGAFRDTGYYSFKSSEESVKSLGNVERSSPPLNYSTLPIFKSHPFTETIFEVEEEQDVIAPSLTKRRFTRATNHSLSSSNIPDDIFKGSKTNSLPTSCRNKNALLSSVSQRARSSFFSTSGVLRKLSLLRDDKSLARKLRAKVRSSSGGTLRSNAGGVPHISVSDYSESLSNRGSVSSPAESGRKEEDVECATAYYSRSQTSLSSFGVRSESMSSIYSAAGGGRYGVVSVSGEILFSLSYNYKFGVLEVLIKECRNLAAVDAKRNRSDPYVKVYLLPDRTKAGKRKTKVKKHTLDPVFDEILKFDVSVDELENRTLWLSIWHSDIFGRNDFLGEVTLPLARDVFKESNLRWFPLQDKIDAMDHCCKGNLFVALKYIPFDTTNCKRTKRVNKGTLHVMVKEAHHLMPTRSNGTADPFCKCYLLPDRSKTGKQKTAVIKKTCDPKWNHTFIYDDVNIDDLRDRCLELTVWDYDKLTSNDFLGGVRLSLGTGKHCGQQVDWMDSSGEEITLWQQMLERFNMWVYGELRLRPTLQSRH